MSSVEGDTQITIYDTLTIIQVVESFTPLMAIGSCAIQYACIVCRRTFLGLMVH